MDSSKEDCSLLFLEGLLYNVPNDKFGTSYEDTFVNAYNWIINADSTEFVCATSSAASGTETK